MGCTSIELSNAILFSKLFPIAILSSGGATLFFKRFLTDVAEWDNASLATLLSRSE